MTDRRTFLYEDFEISYEDTKKRVVHALFASPHQL